MIGAINLLLEGLRDTDEGKNTDWDDDLMRLLRSKHRTSAPKEQGQEMTEAERAKDDATNERAVLQQAHDALSRFSTMNLKAILGLEELNTSIQLAAEEPSGLGELAGAASMGNLDRYSQALVLAGETELLHRLWTKSQRQ